MKNAHWIVPGVLFSSVLWASSATIDDHIQLTTFQSHSRLSIQIDESVPAEWKASSNGFELDLKGIGLMDLGAPLGDENSWKDQFSSLSDIRVEGIQIQELSNGVKIIGKWKFPKGKLALANPKMEFFDFHEKDPTRYVVDFWIKQGPTVAEVRATHHRNELLASIKKTQEEEKRRIGRKIASIKRHKEEVENSRKYCEEPLDESNDVFLQFYPLHQRVDFSRWLSGTTADSDFLYFRPRKKNKEAQYIRLAIEMYSQGNSGLALRTLEFFDHEFPRSESQTEMKFLRANALLKLGYQREGEAILARLMDEVKYAPVALRSAAFLARRLMAQDLYLAAMEKFLWLIRHFPNDPLGWTFHLGAAECFYNLKQTTRAAKEYEWIMENGPDSSIKAEAASRMGDLYLSRFQYEQAVSSYSQSDHYFKQQMKNFPAFFLNWGESLYQLRHYEESKTVMNRFLEAFPSYPGGWRATFRLGEIEARTSKQGISSENSRKRFYDTINHYPFTSGSTLARIRLLPCMDHGGFNLEAQDRFFTNEAKAFASNPDSSKEVLMKNYEDFRALSRIRTLVAMGSQGETADVAMQEIHTVKNSLLKRTLTVAANEYFRKTILELLSQGKKFEALSIYAEKAPLMPPPEEGSSSDYLLQLSRVAADYDLGGLAQQISAAYHTAEELKHKETTRTLAAVSPKHEVPKYQEDSEADTESQLKVSERNFTDAKALWIAVKSQAEPKEYDQIRQLLKGVLDESAFSYEKELILGLIEEREKNLQGAVTHVSRAQLLNNNVRVVAWLASLEARLGDGKTALDLYGNAEKKLAVAPIKTNDNSGAKLSVEDILGVPAAPTDEMVLIAQAEIQEQRSEWGAAASTYSRAIEKGFAGGQVAYQYARSLIKLGGASQRFKAKALLQKLASSQTKGESEEFWKKLAFETLENMPRRGKNE